MTDLSNYIRTIPDYPKEGIMFRDITTLLSSPQGLKQCVDAMAAPFKDKKIDYVAGIEARGFILGSAVAIALGAGFVPVRKKGKLPFDTISQDYVLEYGTDSLEMHIDAIEPDSNILLVDDLIATGGTAQAAIKLIRQLKGEIVAACFVIDLPELGGADKIKALNVEVVKLIDFDGH